MLCASVFVLHSALGGRRSKRASKAIQTDCHQVKKTTAERRRTRRKNNKKKEERIISDKVKKKIGR